MLGSNRSTLILCSSLSATRTPRCVGHSLMNQCLTAKRRYWRAVSLTLIEQHSDPCWVRRCRCRAPECYTVSCRCCRRDEQCSKLEQLLLSPSCISEKVPVHDSPAPSVGDYSTRSSCLYDWLEFCSKLTSALVGSQIIRCPSPAVQVLCDNLCKHGHQ